MPDTIEAQLAEILREVRDLRLLVDRGRRGSALLATERQALATLLPVLHEAFPGRFACWQVLDLAGLDDAHGRNMRIALGTVASAHQLGRLFQRAAGHAVNGLAIERAGRSQKAALWQVCAPFTSLTPP